MDTHANYGGVVPEIASRMHVENITMVIEECLNRANMNMDSIDAIAVTYGPIQYTDHFRIFTISALCLVALCPIVIYIVVQNNLAIISNKMKVKTLKIYDKKAKRDTTIDEATKLKNRIEFCHSLFQMREGPKFVKDYTAMFTFLSGIIQLAIILMENQGIKRTMDLDKAIQTIYTQI